MAKMNKKGFTLVELLAVIVVLAVILVIAVPRINDHIIESKKKTFMNSAKNIARELEYKDVEKETFKRKYINEFDIELSDIDYDKNSSLAYYNDNNKVAINLVGSGRFEGMYACEVTSSSVKEVQDTPCETKFYSILTINLDGGTTTQTFEDRYEIGTSITLINPTKEDHIFAGWSKTSGDATLSENTITIGITDTTIKATWEEAAAKIYTIKYNCNGGIGTPATQTATYGQPFKALDSGCTRSGYTLKMWTSDNGNAPWPLGWSTNSWNYDNGQYGITNNEVTLKAKWEPKEYTIKYDCDGGTGTPATSKVKTGEAYTVPSGCTRNGYTLKMWTSDNGNAPWPLGWSTNSWNYDNGQYGIANNEVTLKAKWEPNTLTLKIHANGATKNSDGATVNETVETSTYPYNGTIGYNWPSDYKYPYSHKLVRPGYKASGVYHVGSATSTTTIGQDYITDTQGVSVVTLATRLGILNNLNAGDYTLHLYAGWTQCAAGTYSNTYSTSCDTCTAGTTSSAGASSCSACTNNAGVNTWSSGCTINTCKANYYKDGNVCKEHPAGTRITLTYQYGSWKQGSDCTSNSGTYCNSCYKAGIIGSGRAVIVTSMGGSNYSDGHCRKIYGWISADSIASGIGSWADCGLNGSCTSSCGNLKPGTSDITTIGGKKYVKVQWLDTSNEANCKVNRPNDTTCVIQSRNSC